MSPAIQKEHGLEHIKTVVIDNYDSYTFNLLQLFDNPDNVVVIRNDQFTWEEFSRTILPHFDNVVISPGPGRPDRDADFGLCTQIIEAQLDPSQAEHHRPVFGVCLGHQGIGHLLGGKVVHAPRIMHGRMSQVFHLDHSLDYNDIMYQCLSPFWVVRYHSLVVEKDSLPDDLAITAFCYEDDGDVEALRNSRFLVDKDDESLENKRFHYLDQHIDEVIDENRPITVMGFQHKKLPLWGVQFHPESVSTEYGIQMMTNFQRETYRWMQDKGNRHISYEPLSNAILSHSAALPTAVPQAIDEKRSQHRLHVKTSASNWIDPEALVEELLANHIKDDQYLGWLDSSRKNSIYSKFSVLSFSPAMTLTYSTLHREMNIKLRNSSSPRKEYLQHGTTFFDYISNLLGQYTDIRVNASDEQAKVVEQSGFQGGLIGYFGYEMKRESMDGYQTPKEQQCACKYHGDESLHQNNCCACVEEPDAAFQLVDQFYIFDQREERIYLCCIDSQEGASQWIKAQETLIRQASESIRKRKFPVDEAIGVEHNRISTTFTPDTDHKSYLRSIQKCVDYIREGESYEICLTTRFRLDLPKNLATSPSDPRLWRLYTHHLRKNNPAPFSALMMFPRMGIMSSSPERFLKVDASQIAEMKPIKGTIARVLDCVCESEQCDFGKVCKRKQEKKDDERKQQLWQDVKERAENLMIVDLIRNDLSQVCHPKSVCVPKLMHVETYEKVHHLVSTIRGTIRPNVSSVEVLKKCFPPGSMTGAPKLRSVQILDELEQHRPRGVYSGCLGYFSFSGSADFNVVIRTAVASTKADDGIKISVGGGGAVTFLSDPEQEWREAVLKTKSVAPSVKEFLES